MATVLFPEAEGILIGRDIIGVLLRLRSRYEIPPPEDMATFQEDRMLLHFSAEEIHTHVKALTGQDAKDLLTLTGRSEDIENLRALAHLLIIKANQEYSSKYPCGAVSQESEDSD